MVKLHAADNNLAFIQKSFDGQWNFGYGNALSLEFFRSLAFCLSCFIVWLFKAVASF